LALEIEILGRVQSLFQNGQQARCVFFPKGRFVNPQFWRHAGTKYAFVWRWGKLVAALRQDVIWSVFASTRINQILQRFRALNESQRPQAVGAER